MTSLTQIVEKLKENSEVDAVFLTGSHGVGDQTLHSDIDLVVILKENRQNLRSLYRWFDGVFADVFFFDLADLERVTNTKELDWNSADGSLVDWVQKADIQFDHSGSLTKLKAQVVDLTQTGVTRADKRSFWQKINYNLVANQRYFASPDPLYHEALNLRLLYSVMELVCGYLAFRDIPWRGEKQAVQYLQAHTTDFYDLLQQYHQATTLSERFQLYEQLFALTFTPDFQPWSQTDQIVMKNDFSIVELGDEVEGYVESLFG